MGDDYSGYVLPSTDFQTSAPSETINPAASAPATNWSNIFASSFPSLISNAFKTLQLGIAPTGSALVVGPNGSYTVANQAGAIPSLSTLGSSGSGLLWIGGALLGVFLIAEIAKK